MNEKWLRWKVEVLEIFIKKLDKVESIEDYVDYVSVNSKVCFRHIFGYRNNKMEIKVNDFYDEIEETFIKILKSKGIK